MGDDLQLVTLIPERAADLERRRAEVRNQWRIAEECGETVSAARKVADMVWLEMKFFCHDFMRGMNVAEYARQYVLTGNPHYIDGAVYLCSLSGIAPPPSLATLVAEVAKLRFSGNIRAGTASQIRKANAKGYALNMMVNLCAAGATVDVAASKVARHLADNGGGFQFKASTLEKEYGERMRGHEHWRRAEFVAEDGRDKLDEWRRILAQLPDAEDDLKGWRR